jgi:hypothetical protein
MTATVPAHPPVHNRIARHLPQPLPATTEERRAVWADAVFAAALFYQAQLAGPDPVAAERAARAIFDLEKTRLRHGRGLAGDDETPATEPPASQRREHLREIKASERLLEAAVEVGEFEPGDEEFVFPEVDEEALFEEFQRVMPDEYRNRLDECRANLIDLGQNPSEEKVRYCTKAVLLQTLRDARSASARTARNADTGVPPTSKAHAVSSAAG